MYATSLLGLGLVRVLVSELLPRELSRAAGDYGIPHPPLHVWILRKGQATFDRIDGSLYVFGQRRQDGAGLNRSKNSCGCL